MFHTGPTIVYRAPLGGSPDRERLAAERALDSVLADSFPASDPPPWTLGISRPLPARHTTHEAATSDAPNAKGRVDMGGGIVDVSRTETGRPTFRQSLVSIAAAVGIALLVPFTILLIGLPIALGGRGIVEAVSWLIALVFR